MTENSLHALSGWPEQHSARHILQRWVAALVSAILASLFSFIAWSWLMPDIDAQIVDTNFLYFQDALERIVNSLENAIPPDPEDNIGLSRELAATWSSALDSAQARLRAIQVGLRPEAFREIPAALSYLWILLAGLFFTVGMRQALIAMRMSEENHLNEGTPRKLEALRLLSVELKNSEVGVAEFFDSVAKVGGDASVAEKAASAAATPLAEALGQIASALTKK